MKTRKSIYSLRSSLRLPMKLLSVVAIFTSLLLCIILSCLSWRSPELRLTVRRQFNNWHDLLEFFRNEKKAETSNFVHEVMQSAWCNYTLPPQTLLAPFCSCVERTARSFANKTKNSDESVRSLLGCMALRTTWRVNHLWSVRYTTPAVYVFFICTCFHLPSSIYYFGLYVRFW